MSICSKDELVLILRTQTAVYLSLENSFLNSGLARGIHMAHHYNINYNIYVPYLTVYKTHPNFSKANKKKSTIIKLGEIDTMNITNDNTFNWNNSLLSNDRYMKITLKSKLIGVAR